MTAAAPSAWSHFRLSFEQQRKRAEDLLEAARDGDPQALARFDVHPPELAEAQLAIARGLRVESWAAMERHITAMTRERRHIGDASRSADGEAVLDADERTLHIRCGSDLRTPLQLAGFCGDFYEHSYPYLIGPVREGPGSLEQRARFLVESYGRDRHPPLEFDATLAGLERDERRLRDSAGYARVVIWSEHDCYDQLVLLRLLGHYARHPCPPQLELVNVDDWPGTARFIGLGQLPPEALHLLWRQRKAVTTEQLALGLAGWRALAEPEPRALAALMRSGTPALPLLAPALHRHLRELPSLENGLGFTQQMALALLADEPQALFPMFGKMSYGLDPLPGQGDSQMRDRVLPMGAVSPALFSHAAGVDRDGNARPPWTDVLTITDAGRAVLRGELDFMSLQPAARWVGGVEIGSGRPDWRWNERARDAALRRA